MSGNFYKCDNKRKGLRNSFINNYILRVTMQVTNYIYICHANKYIFIYIHVQNSNCLLNAQIRSTQMYPFLEVTIILSPLFSTLPQLKCWSINELQCITIIIRKIMYTNCYN